MIQKLKSLWHTIFITDKDAIKELNEVLRQVRSLSKEDKKLIGKSLRR